MGRCGPVFLRLGDLPRQGAPVDPNRLYASQSSGWFGQVIQRSDDGGKTWEPVDAAFAYDGVPGDTWAPIVRDLPAVLSVEVQTLA